MSRRNLERARELVRQAATAGALLVGLPENFAYLGNDRDHRLAIAETVPDPGTPARPPARRDRPDPRRDAGAGPRDGTWLLLGGFPERGARQQDPQQRRAARPFRGGGLRLSEDAPLRRRRPGRQALPRVGGDRAGRDAGGGRDPLGGLGLSICYDLRFPELYRALAARGARIVAVPSAFTLETGKDHWHVLLRARAIENQVFLHGAGAVRGRTAPTGSSYGHALVVDPWGVVLAECGDHEGFALARLDFDYQDQGARRPARPDAPPGLAGRSAGGRSERFGRERVAGRREQRRAGR